MEVINIKEKVSTTEENNCYMVNNSCFHFGKMKLMRQIFKLNVQQAPLTNLRSAIEKLSYWLADLSGKDIKSCSHDTGKNSLQNNV